MRCVLGCTRPQHGKMPKVGARKITFRIQSINYAGILNPAEIKSPAALSIFFLH